MENRLDGTWPAQGNTDKEMSAAGFKRQTQQEKPLMAGTYPHPRFVLNVPRKRKTGIMRRFPTFLALFSRFFRVFPRLNKAYRLATAYIVRRVGVMRMKRDLAEHVWYEVRTAVNVGEPLFLLGWAVVLLYRVLREAKKRFAFEMRGLKFEGALLTFYIKPADGKELPDIMQWMMNFVH
jgi:hypothetical protein